MLTRISGTDYENQNTVSPEGELKEAPVVQYAVSKGYRTVEISWTPVEGAKSSRLYYKGGNVSEWTLPAVRKTSSEKIKKMYFCFLDDGIIIDIRIIIQKKQAYESKPEARNIL